MDMLSLGAGERHDRAESLDDRPGLQDLANHGEDVGIGVDERVAEAAGQADRDHESPFADLEGLIGLPLAQVACMALAEFPMQGGDLCLRQNVVEDRIPVLHEAVAGALDLFGLGQVIGRKAAAIDPDHTCPARASSFPVIYPTRNRITIVELAMACNSGSLSMKRSRGRTPDRDCSATAYHRYLIYGLVVESEIPLSSVEKLADGPAVPAIRVSAAMPDHFDACRPDAARDPLDWVQHVVLADGSVYMKAEDVFETVISCDGRRVVCASLGGADPRSLEAHLVNFIVSASLTLQGEEPLHSTVVEIEGRAIGLLGLSGAGKSTLAAFLIGQGADLVTDDMLRVVFSNGAPLAYPGPYRLKLFEEPGRRFLPGAFVHGYFNAMSGKVMLQPRAGTSAHRPPRPLSALFHLDADRLPSDGAVGASRLAGLELVKAIISSAMDNRYADPRRLERQLRFATKVAEALPVYDLRYPRSFDVMDEVAHVIRRLARL